MLLLVVLSTRSTMDSRQRCEELWRACSSAQETSAEDRTRSDSMRCPVCDDQLRPLDRNGVEIEMCPSCKGVWLDRGELDTLLEAGATGEFFTKQTAESLNEALQTFDPNKYDKQLLRKRSGLPGQQRRVAWISHGLVGITAS